MLTREEKIDAIYENVANKDLSFGCKIFHKVDWKRWFKAKIITDKIEREDGTFYWVKLDSENSVTWLQEKEMEIIGHPVMIGNVLDYFWNKKWLMTLDRILRFYEEKTKMIEEQSDKCIDYIYNLICK